MLRLTTLRLPAVLVCHALICCVAVGQNFTADDPEIRTAAEAARVASARFWTGEPLPGRWSRPCPVTVRLIDHAGGGRTSFVFRDGEVGGWSMHVEGRRTAILKDVIPHEVDHAVRASLVRRPVVRWLDEGSAALMESPESHARLREQAAAFVNVPLADGWFDRPDYPDSADSVHVTQLYAVGLSLVEYLLERGGPERLLAFQRDARPPSRKLADHYGCDVDALVRRWRDWQRTRTGLGNDCRAVGCAVHAIAHRQPACDGQSCPGEPLTIWTATWCGSCRRFWQDFRDDPAFRGVITSRFHVHAVDVDQHRRAADAAGMTSVPVFQWQRSRVIGYQGKSWLLGRLGFTPAVPAGDAPPHPVIETVDAPGDELAASAPSPPVRPFRLLGRLWGTSVPIVLTTLEMFGILGSTAATGGIGAIALGALWRAWRRRGNRRRKAPQADADIDVLLKTEGGERVVARAPFPRRLDEARQLLALRQSEGRVAVLDALRGMFLDDELQKLTDSPDERDVSIARRLRNNIDTRVDEVAPLSTTID